MLARFRLRYGSRLFISHLAAVILVSGSVGTYFYSRALDSLMRSLRSRLQNSAALLSYSVEPAELEGIVSEKDTQREAYQRNLTKLRQVRRLNPDLAFLYVMRKDGDKVRFVIDSDETAKQAPPGREYTPVPDRMLAGFESASVDDKLYRDEWGVFLSGYAPLHNGQGRYLVGMDMRADEVDYKLAELRLTGLVSLLASVLLALLFALSLSRGLSRSIERVTRRCQQVAGGRLEPSRDPRTYDEFDDLNDSFDQMLAQLGQAREETADALAALRVARDQLTSQVQQQSAHLQDAQEQMDVLRGLLPICSSCKKIRDDQGYWQQVEVFVEAHTDARFTHGLCPACAVQLYGDILSKDALRECGIELDDESAGPAEAE